MHYIFKMSEIFLKVAPIVLQNIFNLINFVNLRKYLLRYFETIIFYNNYIAKLFLLRINHFSIVGRENTIDFFFFFRIISKYYFFVISIEFKKEVSRIFLNSLFLTIIDLRNISL